MFRKAKYVVIKQMGLNPLVVFIFPQCVSHLDFINRMGFSKEDVDSAGFVSHDEHNGVFCSGRSDSIGVEANSRDRRLIIQMMFEED